MWDVITALTAVMARSAALSQIGDLADDMCRFRDVLVRQHEEAPDTVSLRQGRAVRMTGLSTCSLRTV